MSTPTVRVTGKTHHILQELAKQSGQTMTDILDKALDAYRRQVFFEQLNAGYAELRADPKAWAQMEKERKQLDATLPDGLDADERWTEDGRCLNARKGKA
jgi:hypothetical protein